MIRSTRSLAPPLARRSAWLLAALSIPLLAARVGGARPAPEEAVTEAAAAGGAELAVPARPQGRPLGWARCEELLGRIADALEAFGAPPDPAAFAALELDAPAPPARELHLRARELGRKARRLAREHRVAVPELEPLEAREPGEAEVARELAGVLDRLRAVRPEAVPPYDPEAPASVPAVGFDAARCLRALLAAGRALDELADRPPTAGDVHHEVTRALAFASSLRSRAPGRRMPLDAPLEPVCTNDDVHVALVDCWERAQALIEAAGGRSARVAPPSEALQVKTSELLELASILADELELLHDRFGDPSHLPPVARPGTRRTAELLQRSMLLRRQLDSLRALAALPAPESVP